MTRNIRLFVDTTLFTRLIKNKGYSMDPFWLRDPKVLFSRSRAREFWPAAELSIEEKLNAITRFVLYACVILAVYRNDVRPLVAGLGVCILIAIVAKEVSNGRFKPLQPSHAHPNVERLTTKECQKPTKTNPLANMMPSDYETNADRPAACPIDSVKEEVDAAFYKDGHAKHDHFNRRIDQRQFFSNPVTTSHSDSKGFATWLYGDMGTCKSNHTTCTGTDG